MRSLARHYLAIFIVIARKTWKVRGFIWRVFLATSIGLTLLWTSKEPNFDFRFKLRKLNNPSKNVVLIEVSNADLQSWKPYLYSLGSFEEIVSRSDNEYWYHDIWTEFLDNLIQLNPASVGVTLFFGSNIDSRKIREPIPPIFFNKKIIWSSRVDQEGRILFPVFSNDHQRNTGLIKIKVDEDGIARRFTSPFLQISDFSSLLAGGAQSKYSPQFNELTQINFQGPSGTYKRIAFQDVLDRKVKPEDISNKIVIVGASGSHQHNFLTPLGPMTRAEISANITDNFINNQWVRKAPAFYSSLILLFLLIISLFILSYFPHTMAFIFLTWIALTYSAFSIWVFDEFHIWIPIIAPIGQTLATFVIFLSYELSKKDNLNWKLKQEKAYLSQVEKLKDNFISLFSHDLKTPIAKIQAICDRLIAENPESNIMNDLKLLREESVELHRYIQSILQITKVEAKDFKINRESYDLNEIIDEVYERLKSLFEQKGQKVILDLEPLFLIEMDGILIREVVLNLLENANKYSPPGSTITVSTVENEDLIEFKVTDQGPGLSELEVNKVFEKFYRGQEQLNKTKGSGLGLYLAKYFIELHGGRLNLKSELGKGTEVSFYLPV